MSEIKKQLYQELEIKNNVSVEGIAVNPIIFQQLDLGGKYQEQIHSMFEMDHESHVGIDFPVGFTSPGGLKIPFRWDRGSRYSIQFDGSYYLADKEEALFPIEFLQRPSYYKEHTSDGSPMSHVAVYYQEGSIFVTYSNECFLKEKGQDCLFCNINATKDTYGEIEGIVWKTPRQIGETAAAAFKAGEKHITISGGFVPERREVDYYFDVADSIKEYTGLDDFNGTAVIGAPLDLSVIDRYKEVGYRTIGMNIEVWDKNIFNAICPGKEVHCGGWDHWVKALEYAVEVFGFGRVRSTVVAGLAPKKSTLEGVEYLASKGVVCITSPWCPNPGSALEGHRTPEPAWHFDMAKKVAAIYRKAGFTYQQIYDCAAAPTTLCHDIYKIEEELLPVFREKIA
ncbi:MAG TPA: radical SAM protein [Negativicutes bacterium]|nr:radical SAM protein [Negativicutes bacterium]